MEGKKKEKERKGVLRKKGGGEERRRAMSFRGLEERGYWGGQDLILIMLDRHECFHFFNHLQKDKQRKQCHSLTHYVKLGKKRRESSKRKYYIIFPRVIIKAIMIILPVTLTRQLPCERMLAVFCSGHLNLKTLSARISASAFARSPWCTCTYTSLWETLRSCCSSLVQHFHYFQLNVCDWCSY